MEFLQASEPYDWKGLSQQLDIHFELTARIVSARPLVLDVLDMSPIPKDEFSNLCGGLYVIALADARLKGILSQLNFNQLVKAKLFYGGNAEFPHEIVLSELALNARANSSMRGCYNRSGLLLSYRGNGDYVNVYNDGGIYYQDLTLNRFGTQKLSRDELAQLLKTFADSAFDTVPSSPPPMDQVFNYHSLTLICSRFQNVSLTGQETKLAPLLSRLEDLKARATSQAFYLLLTNGRTKLTILEWPFRRVRLSEIEKRIPGAAIPAAMHGTVSEDFLSKLPQTVIIGTAASEPNAYVYVTDADQMYRVVRAPCGGSRPRCNTFGDLTAMRVQQPAARAIEPIFGRIALFAGRTFWPSDLGIDIAHVGKEGHQIANEDYEKHRPFYSKLHELAGSGFGYSFIDDGYIYPGVRICRVDPQAPPTRCTNPDEKTY